jgi:hypothetical protein
MKMSEEIRTWTQSRLLLHIADVVMPVTRLNWVSGYPLTRIHTIQSGNAGFYTGPSEFTASFDILQIGNEVKDLIEQIHSKKEWTEAILTKTDDTDSGEWAFESIAWAYVHVNRCEATGHEIGGLPVIAISFEALRMKVDGAEYGSK